MSYDDRLHYLTMMIEYNDCSCVEIVYNKKEGKENGNEHMHKINFMYGLDIAEYLFSFPLYFFHYCQLHRELLDKHNSYFYKQVSLMLMSAVTSRFSLLV